MLELIEDIEKNLTTKEYRIDQRELEIVSNYRSGKITLEESDKQLGDLSLIQQEEHWEELQEEYKDDAETLRFMADYGYVPFSFELEEWREDDDYPFDDLQKQRFINARREV